MTVKPGSTVTVDPGPVDRVVTGQPVARLGANRVPVGRFGRPVGRLTVSRLAAGWPVPGLVTVSRLAGSVAQLAGSGLVTVPGWPVNPARLAG